jgi:hypothetical protein
MLIIGLLLFGGAVAVGVDVVAVNNAAVDVDAFGHIFSTSIAGVFMTGVIAAIVGCLGLMLMVQGAQRRRRLVAEAKAGRAERRDSEEAMAAAHADRREAKVERERVDERQEALDVRDRPADREVAADEPVDRKRHRLLHRSDR